jgi:hypothetical protein
MFRFAMAPVDRSFRIRDQHVCGSITLNKATHEELNSSNFYRMPPLFLNHLPRTVRPSMLWREMPDKIAPSKFT